MEGDPGSNPYISEVWDPSLGKNVFLTNSGSGPITPAQYIQSNPNAYKGYTGDVAAVGGIGIGSNAFAPGSGPVRPSAPGGFSPDAYKTAKQQMALNPYDTNYINAEAKQREIWENQVRRIPGANPTYGVIPGTDYGYDLYTGEELDPTKLDPETLAFGKLTSRRPGNIPTLAQTGGQARLSGRGYNLRGSASPEEQAALDRFLAGDTSQAGELAKARMARWQVNDLSPMQKIATRYYGPGLVAAMTAMTGMAGGPLLAGAAGGLMQGGMTNFKDPKAIALGAAGGAVGGWLGGAGAGAAGLVSPAAVGAASGAGASLGRYGGSSAATGKFDPLAALRATLIGGAAGAATGGITGLGQGSTVNTPGEPGGAVTTPPVMSPGTAKYLGPNTGHLVGTGLGILWPPEDPRRRNKLNPYA